GGSPPGGVRAGPWARFPATLAARSATAVVVATTGKGCGADAPNQPGAVNASAAATAAPARASQAVRALRASLKCFIRAAPSRTYNGDETPPRRAVSPFLILSINFRPPSEIGRAHV